MSYCTFLRGLSRLIFCKQHRFTKYKQYLAQRINTDRNQHDSQIPRYFVCLSASRLIKSLPYLPCGWFFIFEFIFYENPRINRKKSSFLFCQQMSSPSIISDNRSKNLQNWEQLVRRTVCALCTCSSDSPFLLCFLCIVYWVYSMTSPIE